MQGWERCVLGALKWFMGCVGWWVVWAGKEVVGGSAMKGSVIKHSSRSVALGGSEEGGCVECWGGFVGKTEGVSSVGASDWVQRGVGRCVVWCGGAVS